MDWRDAYDTAIIERNFAIINGQEWQARAEAAEQRVVEQQVVINMLMSEPHPLDPIIRRHERDYAEQQKAYFASLDRIIELEAQLAAQAWRPVTEPPKEADKMETRIG